MSNEFSKTSREVVELSPRGLNFLREIGKFSRGDWEFLPRDWEKKEAVRQLLAKKNHLTAEREEETRGATCCFTGNRGCRVEMKAR